MTDEEIHNHMTELGRKFAERVIKSADDNPGGHWWETLSIIIGKPWPSQPDALDDRRSRAGDPD